MRDKIQIQRTGGSWVQIEAMDNIIVKDWSFVRRGQDIYRLYLGMFVIAAMTLISSPSAHAEGDQSISHENSRIMTEIGKVAPPIIENKGQVSDERVRYYMHSSGVSAYFTDDGLVMDLYRAEDSGKEKGKGLNKERVESGIRKGVVVRIGFIGAEKAKIRGEAEKAARVNYLIGSDPGGWRRGIPTFGEVLYNGLYPGIDLRYISESGRLKYQFELTGGADPSLIRVSMDGIDGLSIDGDGNLIIETALGQMKDIMPYAYQIIDGRRVEVASSYHRIVDDTGYGFKIGDYNRRYPLIIDPSLEWSTYLGGSGNDRARGISVDGAGNVYIIGDTTSVDLPVTAGAYQTTYGGGTRDAFVSKFSPDGQSLLYSTYLGGSGDDFGKGISVDGAGNAYITGNTGGWKWWKNFS